MYQSEETDSGHAAGEVTELFHCLTWTGSGVVEGEFGTPVDLAVDSQGCTYVLDYAKARVQKFDSEGGFVLEWGAPGQGQGEFVHPQGICVGAGERIYVADSGNHRIQVFDSSGVFLLEFGENGTGDGQFNSPVDVAAGAAGDVYVVDQGNHRVQRFGATGEYLSKWGAQGFGEAQFVLPSGIAIDAAGNCYVSDAGNHRIQVFASDGTCTTRWGSQGSGRGELISPSKVDIDSQGRVNVVDLGNSRIQVFSAAGEFIREYGSVGSGHGEFMFAPVGAGIAAHGEDVYVADGGNRRVVGIAGIEKRYGWGTDMTKAAVSREEVGRLVQENTAIASGTEVRTWEVELPGDTYRVSLGCGDTQYSAGPHRVVVEGEVVVNNVSTAPGEVHQVKDVPVTVTDGALTVEIGGEESPTLINYIRVEKELDPGEEGIPRTEVASLYDSTEHPYPSVYRVELTDPSSREGETVVAGSESLAGEVINEKTLALAREDKVLVTHPLLFARISPGQALPVLPDSVNVLFGYDVKGTITKGATRKVTIPLVEIVNRVVLSKGLADDPQTAQDESRDSDDCYVAGEGADMTPNGKPVPVDVYYRLREQVEAVRMEISWKGQDGFVRKRELHGLPAAGGVELKAQWDGRDEAGEYVTNLPEGIVHVQMRVLKGGQWYMSDKHRLYELSSYFRPEIYLQATEFSPPASTEIMLKHYRMFYDSPVGGFLPGDPFDFHIISPGPGDMADVMALFNNERYYMDLNDPSDGNVYGDYPENWRKRGFGGTAEETPTLYTHAVTRTIVEDIDGTPEDRTAVFLQYWMFYPSSTPPIGINGNANCCRYDSGGVSQVTTNDQEKTTTITNSTRSWRPNEWLGRKILIFRPNNGFGYWSEVVSNSTNSLTVRGRFDNAVAYRIHEGTDTTFHEGDWEMAMLVVEMDPGEEMKGRPWLRSVTASQHYTGQTLPTKTGRYASRPELNKQGVEYDPAGVDYVQLSGHRPKLYIGAGSHATFFKEGTFGTMLPFVPASLEEGISISGFYTWTRVYLSGEDEVSADSTAPLNSVASNDYELKVLPYHAAQWKGHWGEYLGIKGGLHASGGNPPCKRSDKFDEIMLTDFVNWHNRYVQNGKRNCPGTQEFVRITVK